MEGFEPSSREGSRLSSTRLVLFDFRRQVGTTQTYACILATWSLVCVS